MATTNAITYARVSTGKQAESGLSLDDQRERMTAACMSRGWDIIAEHVDAGRSGRSMGARPELNAALEALDAGEAQVLVCSKFDRLARSIIDLSRIMARADRHGWNLIVLDLDLDLSTPSGRMVGHIVGAVAQYESDIIAERVTMSHQQMRKRGKRSGMRPVTQQHIRDEIIAARDNGLSYRAIAADLTARAVPTARGGAWHAASVRQIVNGVMLDRELAAVNAD